MYLDEVSEAGVCGCVYRDEVSEGGVFALLVLDQLQGLRLLTAQLRRLLLKLLPRRTLKLTHTHTAIHTHTHSHTQTIKVGLGAHYITIRTQMS